jgi:hypothetical protein
MEKKKASKLGAQKSPVSKVWLCKSFRLSISPWSALELLSGLEKLGKRYHVNGRTNEQLANGF